MARQRVSSRAEHIERRVRRVDAWLAKGGIVLASSERAARSLSADMHAARVEDGLTAWPTPAIFAWESWIRDQWLERNRAGLMLLNGLQEQAVWAGVIGASEAGAELLHSRRLANAAQRACKLLADYAPAALRSSARSGWSGDSAIFSDWLTEFERRCDREGLISAARLVLRLTQALLAENGDSQASSVVRLPILLIGFDRLLPTQRALLDAWGGWLVDSNRDKDDDDEGIYSAAALPGPGQARYVTVSDSSAELAACIEWLGQKLGDDKHARLIVVTPGLGKIRGELERALLHARASSNGPLDFEFSLGVPLAQAGVARSALLLLRWLHDEVSEPELDWLLTSGYTAASAEEEIALAETMRALRQRGRERPAWRLDVFLAEGVKGALSKAASLPPAWVSRLNSAREHLAAAAKQQGAMDWAATARQLLRTAGWPGFRPISSVAFQARERWEEVLQECASLGFDGLRMDWAEFVSTASEAVSATIFATRSANAPIQITEPLESAGLIADGIWFLGANQDGWPVRGAPHPLLPVGLQREAGMPYSGSQVDWNLAQQATQRLMGSAAEVVFSYARQIGEMEALPSRLVTQFTGSPQPLHEASRDWSLTDALPLTEVYEDSSLIPFPHASLSGGASLLSQQSQCPFQAFATGRMGVERWQAAETGLTAKERGQLLHEVMHRVWGGPGEGGISTLEELKSIADLRGFVAPIVDAVLRKRFVAEMHKAASDRFPLRYLELEARRLTGLVCEWLDYERCRLPFRVEDTEAKKSAHIAGMEMQLRIDRIDLLPDGSHFIVDYKSGEIGPKAWDGERPDDVQLPFYATFAAGEQGERLEGLLFAKVRPGKMEFRGRSRNAAEGLMADLSSSNALVKDPLSDRQLDEWRRIINGLGEDFGSGRADVDPKDGARTCATCRLHAVCRIHENQPLGVESAGLDDDDGSAEADDEGGPRDDD